MCGRYYLKTPPAAISARFNLTLFEDEPDKTDELIEDLNMTPSQLLPVVLNTSPHSLSYARWGFIPVWMKDPKGGHKPINAVGETVASNGYFRTAFKSRRCLVVASGFYEWARVDDKVKQPYRIALKTGELFAMAGVWDIKRSEEGEIPTFAIVTVQANELVGEIHSRMPVFLQPEHEKVWLDTASSSTIDAQALIHPFPSELMTMEPLPVDYFKRPAIKNSMSLFGTD